MSSIGHLATVREAGPIRRAAPPAVAAGLALAVMVVAVLVASLPTVAVAELVLTVATARAHGVLAANAPSLEAVLRRDASVVLALGDLLVLIAVVRTGLLAAKTSTVVVAALVAV